MNYVTGNTHFHMEGPCAVSLGKFDGVHRGHQKLLRHVLSGKDQGLAAVIFTFEKKSDPDAFRKGSGTGRGHIYL